MSIHTIAFFIALFRNAIFGMVVLTYIAVFEFGPQTWSNISFNGNAVVTNQTVRKNLEFYAYKVESDPQAEVINIALVIDTPTTNLAETSTRPNHRVDQMQTINLDIISAVTIGTFVTLFGLIIQAIGYAAFDMKASSILIAGQQLLFPFLR